MPYPSILKDLNAKAIPQVYDGNNFQPDTGKRILYGPNGVTPLSVVDSKLGIRATELEAKLQSMLDDGVPQSGSNVDLRGLDTNKPAANSVDVGVTYWSVDTDPHMNSLEVSDGTQWVVI